MAWCVSLTGPAASASTCMSFGIYLAGYALLVIGLAVGANLLDVPAQWIGVGALCLLGIGIVHGVSSTRQKDSAN